MIEYTEKYLIDPDPEWIRPAKFPDGRWYGYCASGPQDGVFCPYGDKFVPKKINKEWYWVLEHEIRNTL